MVLVVMMARTAHFLVARASLGVALDHDAEKHSQAHARSAQVKWSAVFRQSQTERFVDCSDACGTSLSHALARRCVIPRPYLSEPRPPSPFKRASSSAKACSACALFTRPTLALHTTECILSLQSELQYILSLLLTTKFVLGNSWQFDTLSRRHWFHSRNDPQSPL
eukprot:1078375-Pleurochrysis_carterae.AAC.2